MKSRILVGSLKAIRVEDITEKCVWCPVGPAKYKNSSEVFNGLPLYCIIVVSVLTHAKINLHVRARGNT